MSLSKCQIRTITTALFDGATVHGTVTTKGVLTRLGLVTVRDNTTVLSDCGVRLAKTLSQTLTWLDVPAYPDDQDPRSWASAPVGYVETERLI